MRRPWQIWLAFAVCLTLVVAAIGWLSVKALQADREQASARRQADLEERVALALWRMDSTLVPKIAQAASGGSGVLVAQGGKAAEPSFAQSQANRQGNRGQSEFQARQQFVTSNTALQSWPNSIAEDKLLQPLWKDGGLVLTRRTEAGSTVPDGVSTIKLDWPTIKTELLADITDLLPNADLVEAQSADWSSESRLLAALPVRLIPGQVPDVNEPGWSPIQLALLAAWSAMALAALAVAFVLQGVIALSERRAAFVSAVTHELRTPLTTFRMYAEMLSEGMVGEEDRKSYLNTLRLEAERLTHLVANVLAYARLERGGVAGRIETVTVDCLLSIATERLADRAAQSGFVLRVEADSAFRQQVVSADPGAVEQILFNLVDNACKYATGGERALSLRVGVENQALALRVCDTGPGISAIERKRLFQPFRKSAQDAAQSAPGVGLGLALSRRLAREMGGDLRYESNGAGACFVLTLRVH